MDSQGSPPSPNIRLLDQVRQTLRLKHYSIRTEDAYVQWIRRFILFHGKSHPRVMGEREITAFLTHLAVTGKVAASTQYQALSALLFLYKAVLNRELDRLDDIERAKRPKRLPVVFTRDEVKAILSKLEGVQWLIASLLYGSGLRLMEALRLRVKDLDFDYRQITVRDGKGQKDRITMLPQSLLAPLQAQLNRVQERHQEDIAGGYGEVWLPYALERKYPNAAKELGWQYVFPSHKLSVDPRSGVTRRHHIGMESVQDAVKRAIHAAGIRTLYERLIQAGKPPKVAITACMRKMLTILNAMVRDGRPWQADFAQL